MDSALQTEFNKLIKDQEELRRQFQERAQELFKSITKEFFEKNPGITGVVWTQYTPYFNDGETCEFSVNDCTFTNAPIDELDNISWGDYDGDTEGVWATENVAHVLSTDREYYKEMRELIMSKGGVDPESCKLFSDAICSSEMEDVMLAMFGDHVKVIATRTGFDVDDFSHD